MISRVLKQKNGRCYLNKCRFLFGILIFFFKAKVTGYLLIRKHLPLPIYSSGEPAGEPGLHIYILTVPAAMLIPAACTGYCLTYHCFLDLCCLPCDLAAFVSCLCCGIGSVLFFHFVIQCLNVGSDIFFGIFYISQFICSLCGSL